MRWLRWLGRIGRLGLSLLALAPPCSLAVATLVDRGPDGSTRPTIFPLALGLLDPAVGDGLRHSLIVSLVAALGALVVGTALGVVMTRWRFWGRAPLAVLVVGSAAVPPAVNALGLRSLVGAGRDVAGPGLTWWQPWTWTDVGAGWVAWAAAALLAGVPIVALTVGSALRRIDASWEEAARASGAGPRRLWWSLTWPLLRRPARRAAAAVFALTLLEPGAPLVLGLRRTLAVQIVEALWAGPDHAARAAVLALIGAAFAAAARALAGWHDWPDAQAQPTARSLRRPSWRQALVGCFLLAAWAALAWGPTALLVADGLTNGGRGGSAAAAASSVGTWLSGPLRDSLTVGLLATALLGIAAACLAGPWRDTPGEWLGGTALQLMRLPPLVLAAGLALLPGALWTVADGSGFLPSGARAFSAALRRLSLALDPVLAPGVLLVIGLALWRLPWMVGVIDDARGLVPAAWLESARTLGATRRRAAWTIAVPRLAPLAVAALLLAVALAATDIPLALALAPTNRLRPFGPALLELAELQPTAAAALALAAIALRTLAWIAFLGAAPQRPGQVPLP